MGLSGFIYISNSQPMVCVPPVVLVLACGGIHRTPMHIPLDSKYRVHQTTLQDLALQA